MCVKLWREKMGNVRYKGGVNYFFVVSVCKEKSSLSFLANESFPVV